MTSEQLQSIGTWFSVYTAPFVDAGNSLAPLHAMKRDHTLRVAQNSITIARALGWCDDDLRIAEAIALLHDVGRFTQLEEFRTFADRLSVNHAERARDVVLEEGVLDDVEDGERECILAAVVSHNCIRLCDSMAASHRRHAELIRDADKLDIYEIVQTAIRSGHIEKHPEIAISVRLKMTVSDAILDEVRRRQLGTYQHMKTLGDFLLVQMSWVYDLNYSPTAQLIRERGVMKRIVELLPDEHRIREITDQAESDLAARAV